MANSARQIAVFVAMNEGCEPTSQGQGNLG
jgi:hypothetical protein